MRLYEHRQSATSPLKYILELRPEEFEITKELVTEIMKKIEEHERKQQGKQVPTGVCHEGRHRQSIPC